MLLHTFGPSTTRLDPIYPNDDAVEQNVHLLAGTYLRGTVLGELLGVNEVQRISFGGTVTGGTYTVSFNGQTTGAIAHNATAATVRAALEALTTIGVGNVAVTGGPGPGTPYTVTFQNARGFQNVSQMTTTSSLTGTAPTVLVATLTAGSAGTPGVYKAYANGSTDGSQTAKALLKYSCVVDGSGNVTVLGEHEQTQRGAPAYFGGGAIYRTTQLIGLDADALVDLQAFLVQGSIADGQVKF